MNYDELVKELRSGCGLPILQDKMNRAADAIEELQAQAHNSHRSFAFAIAELFLRILGELGYEITIPYDKDYTDGTQTIKMRWKEEEKDDD